MYKRQIRGLLEAESQGNAESHGAQNISLRAAVSGSIAKKPGRLSTKWSTDSEQSLSDIVADLKHDAKVIQSRRTAHDRSQGSDDTPMCKRTQLCDDSDSHSSAPGAPRHLLPWGQLDSIDIDDEDSWQEEGQRRQLLAGTQQVATALGASKLWNQGFRGGGIRVGTLSETLSGLYFCVSSASRPYLVKHPHPHTFTRQPSAQYPGTLIFCK